MKKNPSADCTPSAKNGTGAGIYEFVFNSVPKKERKKTSSVFFVLAGYTIALSCLVAGAKIGFYLPFRKAVLASLCGNAFLIFIGIGTGVIAARTGLSTTFIARRIFGKKASVFFSLLIIFACISWVGINGNLFSSMIISVFPSWSLPLAFTAILVIAIWSQSAIRGWRGLVFASRIVVPISLVLILYCLHSVFTRMNGFSFLFDYVPTETMSFSKATVFIIGNYIFGCMITPDTCRFAKSSKSALCASSAAYITGLFFMNVCGIIIAQAARLENFSTAAAALGLSVPVFLCSVFCLWTTEDNNVYGGSLAIQSVFQGTIFEGNISHRTASYIIVGLSAAFASLNIFKYLIPIVTTLASFFAPAVGIVFADFFIISKGSLRSKANSLVLPVWIIGSIVGYFLQSADFIISPVFSLFFSFALYTLMVKIPQTKKNQTKL